MKGGDFSQLAVDQLVERFVSAALAQDKALLYSDTKKFNRLFDEILKIMRELKSRARDERYSLMPLYDHPNAQVRFSAAVATLELDPVAARSVLEIISDRQEYPQAANARGMMKALDEGRFPDI